MIRLQAMKKLRLCEKNGNDFPPSAIIFFRSIWVIGFVKLAVAKMISKCQTLKRKFQVFFPSLDTLVSAFKLSVAVCKLHCEGINRMGQIVWIARHANRLDFVNPEWFNTAERPFDPPISDDGVVQAQQLAQRLKQENIAHIFASPFLRTVQTANEVAQVLDLPIKLESGLSEWLNPAWMPTMPERLSIEALGKLFPRLDKSYTSRVVAEYPETSEAALERSGKTARLLADEFTEDILLVGHGASVLGATMGLVGETAQTEVNAVLCCLVKIVRQHQAWVMELNGDTAHLSQAEKVIRFH